MAVKGVTELFVFSLSLLERGIYEKSVCNFQSMKSPLELNGVLSKFFCFITWLLYQLIRRNTGRLANKVFTSNPTVSSKQ